MADGTGQMVEAEAGTAEKASRLALTVGALGIVFGDIGTSPLYALRECFSPERGVGTSPEVVLGVVSLLLWSITLVVCVKYLAFVVRADNKGEGGILALVSLVGRGLKDKSSKGKTATIAVLGILGAALLYSDGVITPAVSVLSAVEGLEVIAPSLKPYIVPISLVILFLLFPFQSKGTSKVGRLFGPVLGLWFLVIGLVGLGAIIGNPGILAALNPFYAIRFLALEGGASFKVLGSVFLAMTGAEVLYADLGHFGRNPIRRAWFSLVYPALILNYLGQGAFLLRHPERADNLFFQIAPAWATLPLVALATVATVIASQAVISGSFSLASQSVQLGFIPRVSVRHTSSQTRGQVYVPILNGLLMLGTMGLVLAFRKSGRLANAYGIAVSTDMVITTCLMIFVALRLWRVKPWIVLPLAALFLVIDLSFFVANASKVVSGGWVVVILATAIFILMKTWLDGRGIFRSKMGKFRIEPRVFADSLRLKLPLRVPGTAVFLTGDPNGVPKALLHNLKHNRILHELTIILSVQNSDLPFIEEAERITMVDHRDGMHHIVLTYGYSETPNVPAHLARVPIKGLDPRRATYFVGRESLVIVKGRGEMAWWRKRIYAFMFGNALNATDFFKLPPNNVVEIGSQTEL